VKTVKRKVLVAVLLAVVMLATPLIGAVHAGNGKKTRATFEWLVEQWPLDLMGAGDDTRSKTTKKGDWIVKNVYTYGEGPVVEVAWVTIPGLGNIVTNPASWANYPDGGIRLTIDDGTNEYSLVGNFEKVELVFMQKNKTDPDKRGILEVSKWSFEITDVEEVMAGQAPAGAVGSTMSGTLRGSGGGGVMEQIIGNHGTGIFEGAVLWGTQTIMGGAVLEDPSDPSNMNYMLYSWADGSGEIMLP
jgi:hypothetical protein